MKSRFTNSDIFNNYIKIAESNGLVSLSENDSDKSKKSLDSNPRADSLTKERIEKLYDVTVDTPKEMKYERNIMEIAHPKPAVLTDSYDKLNSLIENNNERQDILINIVNKRTNGLLTNHKYAYNELVKTIVRIGNAMDNTNQDTISQLADSCLEELSKKKVLISKAEDTSKKPAESTDTLPSWLGGGLASDTLPGAVRPFAMGIRGMAPGVIAGAIGFAITKNPMFLQYGAAAGGVAAGGATLFGGGVTKPAVVLPMSCKQASISTQKLIEYYEGLDAETKRTLTEIDTVAIPALKKLDQAIKDVESKSGTSYEHVDPESPLAESLVKLSAEIKHFLDIKEHMYALYNSTFSEFKRLNMQYGPLKYVLDDTLHFYDDLKNLDTAVREAINPQVYKKYKQIIENIQSGAYTTEYMDKAVKYVHDNAPKSLSKYLPESSQTTAATPAPPPGAQSSEEVIHDFVKRFKARKQTAPSAAPAAPSGSTKSLEEQLKDL